MEFRVNPSPYAACWHQGSNDHPHTAKESHKLGADFIRTIGKERALREIGLGNFVFNLVRLAQLKQKLA